MKKSKEEKSRRLLDEMGSLDPKYVTPAGKAPAADPYGDAALGAADRRVRRILLVAACIILVVVVVLPTALLIAKFAGGNDLPSGTPEGGEAVTDENGSAVVDSEGRVLWHYTDGKYYRVPQDGGTWFYDPADQPDYDRGTEKDSNGHWEVETNVFSDVPTDPDPFLETDYPIIPPWDDPYAEAPYLVSAARPRWYDVTSDPGKSKRVAADLVNGSTILLEYPKAAARECPEGTTLDNETALQLLGAYIDARLDPDPLLEMSLYEEALLEPLMENWLNAFVDSNASVKPLDKRAAFSMMKDYLVKEYANTSRLPFVLIGLELTKNDALNEEQKERLNAIAESVGSGSEITDARVIGCAIKYVRIGSADLMIPEQVDTSDVLVYQRDGVWYMELDCRPTEYSAFAIEVMFASAGERTYAASDVVVHGRILAMDEYVMYLTGDDGTEYVMYAPRQSHSGIRYYGRNGETDLNPFNARMTVTVSAVDVGWTSDRIIGDEIYTCAFLRTGKIVEGGYVDPEPEPPETQAEGYLTFSHEYDDGTSVQIYLKDTPGRADTYGACADLYGQYVFFALALEYPVHFSLFEADFVLDKVISQFDPLPVPAYDFTGMDGSCLYQYVPDVFGRMFDNAAALRPIIDAKIYLEAYWSAPTAAMMSEFGDRVAQNGSSPVEDVLVLNITVTRIEVGRLTIDPEQIGYAYKENVWFYQRGGRWFMDPELMDNDLCVDLAESDHLVEIMKQNALILPVQFYETRFGSGLSACGVFDMNGDEIDRYTFVELYGDNARGGISVDVIGHGTSAYVWKLTGYDIGITAYDELGTPWHLIRVWTMEALPEGTFIDDGPVDD